MRPAGPQMGHAVSAPVPWEKKRGALLSLSGTRRASNCAPSPVLVSSRPAPLAAGGRVVAAIPTPLLSRA